MKEYLEELKRISYDLHTQLRKNNNLKQKIISIEPLKEERLKVLMWNFIKIKFKYSLVSKLSYNISDIKDIEEFYDEVFELYIYKFEPD